MHIWVAKPNKTQKSIKKVAKSPCASEDLPLKATSTNLEIQNPLISVTISSTNTCKNVTTLSNTLKHESSYQYDMNIKTLYHQHKFILSCSVKDI